MSYFEPTSIGVLTGGLLSSNQTFMIGNGITSTIPDPIIAPSHTESVTTIDTVTNYTTSNIVPSSFFPSNPKVVLDSKQQQVYSTQTGLISKGVDYITGISTYTGSGIKAMLEFPNETGTAIGIHLSKQLIELTTISVSIHRVKTPAVAMGYINPKGFARGRRCIAGTLIFNKFTKDVLAEFLTSKAFTSDLSKDTNFSKVDQLPAFNLTLLFEDEYGNTSYQRLLGVELVTSGDVYSIQEMLSEQTISFVCADFTPLLPIAQPGSYGALNGNQVTSVQQTPGSIISSSRKL